MHHRRQHLLPAPVHARRRRPTFGGLSLDPALRRVEPELEYIGLDEAIARGLAVTEVDEAGSVSDLFVANPLDVHVLLFEGEELVGAKQNRILDRTILVAAKSKTPVPVSCVERGRWSYRRERFASAPRAAYPELRRVKREGGGQAAGLVGLAAKSARLDACARRPTPRRRCTSSAAPRSRSTSRACRVATDSAARSSASAGASSASTTSAAPTSTPACTRSSCAATRSTRSSGPVDAPVPRRTSTSLLDAIAPAAARSRRRSSASARAAARVAVARRLRAARRRRARSAERLPADGA